MNKKIEKLLPYIYLSPVIILILALGIYPFLYNLYLSFTNYNPIDSVNIAGLKELNLSNFVRIFTEDDRFWHSISLTVVFVIVSVAVELILGIGIASLLKRTLEGKRFVSLLYIPMIITPVVVGLIWRMLFNPERGIINFILVDILGIASKGVLKWNTGLAMAFPSLMIVDIWQWTPFMVVIFLSGLQAVPKSQIEAAEIDGASSWQVFMKIIFPFLKPLVVIAVLIRTMDVFKTYDIVYMLTRGGPGSATEILSYYIYTVAFRHWDLGYGAAISLILFLVIIIISQFLVKRIEV